MGNTKANGINLAYERRGKGNPLVVLHGYPLDRTIWNEVGPELEKNFDLVTPDLRGFGQTDAVEQVFTVADMAADIASLLDHLKIGKAVVAGHSMGGYVALAFARAYPQRLLGLGMISSQLLADPPDRREGRYKTAEEVAQKGVHGVADNMTPKLSADARVQMFVRGVIEMQKAAGVIGALKAMAQRPDSTSLFSNLTIPVLVIHGDADALIPVERAREMKAALASANYAELKALGHMPMMENPQAVGEALKFFMKS
jgi:3-oxoadipate enol-lactonase